MTKLLMITAFWLITGTAFLWPTRHMRACFLACFFSLLIACGLSHRIVWPFFAWDMWCTVRPASMTWADILLVDDKGQEWRYDVSAVPPATPAIFSGFVGRILLGSSEDARPLAEWLLNRAQTLRASPADFHPQWWFTDLGFFPVGPAPRESCTGWSRDPSATPTEFVELVVRERRVHFSHPPHPATEELISERRYPWTGF